MKGKTIKIALTEEEVVTAIGQYCVNHYRRMFTAGAGPVHIDSTKAEFGPHGITVYFQLKDKA